MFCLEKTQEQTSGENRPDRQMGEEINGKKDDGGIKTGRGRES